MEIKYSQTQHRADWKILPKIWRQETPHKRTKIFTILYEVIRRKTSIIDSVVRTSNFA